MGPMTGRAAGYCAGYQMPGYANPQPGRGCGRGFGFGGGRGRGFGFGRGARWGAMPYAAPYAVPSAEQEQIALKSQAENLEAALADIRQRLADLAEAK
jgi:hypothetical protein